MRVPLWQQISSGRVCLGGDGDNGHRWGGKRVMTTTCQRGNLREYFLAVVIRNRTGGSLTERDVEECSWLLGCSNNSELFPSSANLPDGFEESFSPSLEVGNCV